jgi:hypothetical protein
MPYCRLALDRGRCHSSLRASPPLSERYTRRSPKKERSTAHSRSFFASSEYTTRQRIGPSMTGPHRSLLSNRDPYLNRSGPNDEKSEIAYEDRNLGLAKKRRYPCEPWNGYQPPFLSNRRNSRDISGASSKAGMVSVAFTARLMKRSVSCMTVSRSLSIVIM